MATVLRKPLQGVGNIIRFNRHFYSIAAGGILALLAAAACRPSFAPYGYSLLALVLVPVLTSLLVSGYIYDFSGLYRLDWLPHSSCSSLVNVHAGFDETSILLQQRFRPESLRVLDFYDPQKHTEMSIRRARKLYPAFPGTERVSTGALPLAPQSADRIFLLFAAHEIRNDEERAFFFRQLGRALKPGGQIVVTEHLRDAANFLAYNIGYLHFLSRASWLRTFKAAGLDVEAQYRINPFMTTFILTYDRAAS